MGLLIDIKVQLIAKGYSLVHGVDYLYTFSCTHNTNHLLKVLKLLVAKSDNVHQIGHYILQDDYL
jgi:hypothetical protein